MKIQDLLEAEITNIGSGHWDEAQQKWVGTRYGGFVDDETIKFGNLSFEQHLEKFVERREMTQELVNKALMIRSKPLRDKIAMALNGYTNWMIVDENLLDKGNPENTLASQFSQIRKNYQIPIPFGRKSNPGAAIQQALELKKHLFSLGRENSDITVADILHSRGEITRNQSEHLLPNIAKYRIFLKKKNPNGTIPDWLLPSRPYSRRDQMSMTAPARRQK